MSDDWTSNDINLIDAKLPGGFIRFLIIEFEGIWLNSQKLLRNYILSR